MNSSAKDIPISLGDDIKSQVLVAALNALGADIIAHEGEILPLQQVDRLAFRRSKVNGPPLVFGRALYGKEGEEAASYARHFRVYLAAESDREKLATLPDIDSWLEEAYEKKPLRVEVGTPFSADGEISELAIRKRVPKSGGPTFPEKVLARVYAEEGLKPIAAESKQADVSEVATDEPENRDKRQHPVRNKGVASNFSLDNVDVFQMLNKGKFNALHPQDFPDAKLERSFPLIRCRVIQESQDNALIDCYYGIPAGYDAKDIALYKIRHEIRRDSSEKEISAIEGWNSYELGTYEAWRFRDKPLFKHKITCIAREPKLQVLENQAERLDFASNPVLSKNLLFWHADLEELYRQHYNLSSDISIKLPLVVTNHSGRSGVGVCSLKARIEASQKAIYENLHNATFQDALKNGVTFIVNVVEGDRQLRLAEHASTCNRILREAGLPFPERLKAMTPHCNTGQHYVIYQHAAGRHFYVDAHHLVELGSALAVMHTRRNSLPEVPEPNVIDAEGLFKDIRWAIEQVNKQEVDAREKKHILASSCEMQTSIIGQLLERFGSFKALPPQHADIYRALGLTQEKAETFFAERREEEKLFDGLPIVPICWNDLHLQNLLSGANGKITMLDTQNTGKGMPAKELGLGMYFLCVDDDGLLDYNRVWSFMSPYIDIREKESKKTGIPPFCQEEFTAALNRMLMLVDPNRQAHPIALMFQGKKSSLYENFNKRHYAIREQMQEAGYLDGKGRMTEEGAKAVFQNATGRNWMDLPSCKDRAYRHKYGKYLSVVRKAPFEEQDGSNRQASGDMRQYQGRLNSGGVEAQKGAWCGRINDPSNWGKGFRQ